MFQQNINGNVLYGKPFVTADGWVWFRGTDDTLWRVRDDGTEQSKPGSNKTASSPLVTADGWVWFRGTNTGSTVDDLCKMRTDGSQRSTPGNNRTLSEPCVTADGWVWFQGTSNMLCKMRTDGTQQSTPGGNSTKSTPVVTPDGWVWFRGTSTGTDKDALYRMRTDGSQKSRPGSNAAKSEPFITADGWVWFQGTDNGLNCMRTDGSQKSLPGNNSTLATPFVTVDGWVYFRGTNNGLYRMFKDGSQRTVVDSNSTASPLTVSAMTVCSGAVGEWVYWQGTDQRLWRDLVPASALNTETGSPAYYVLTAAYSPPGTEGGNSGSSVEYASGSSTGTATSTENSFKAETDVEAGGETTPIGGSFSSSLSRTDSSSLAITKSKSYRFAMPGPAVDGINHDYDLFLLLLNPSVTAQQYPQNVVLWSMGIESHTGTAMIYSVYAGQLKGTMAMPPGLKAAFEARALTQADYDQILSTNPFSWGSEKIDPDRFVATSQSLPYSPPPDDKTPPVTFTLTLSSDQVQTSKSEVETEYTVGMKVSISFLKDESKFTWTSKNTLEKTTTTSQSARATVGGPAYGYSGPVSVLVYWDTLYSTFMFAFPTSPASCSGTLRDESGQLLAYEPVTLTAGDRQFCTFTDGRGEYRFYNAPGGRGTITFDRQQRHIEVGGDAGR